MSWRLAGSLVKLREQVDELYPDRSRKSDGTIGDKAHKGRPSDHNMNKQGVVCALDLTHDPDNGFDAHKLADVLRVNRHPNLKYIISNRRIASAKTGWEWRPYSGSNPHTKHIHISVGVGADGQSQPPYDDRTSWAVVKGKENSMFTSVDVKQVRWFKVTISADNNGDGWTRIPDLKWGSDPLPLGYVVNGPEPAREGYWYEAPNVWVQANSGGAIVSATGAKPLSTFDVLVTLGKR